MLFVKLMGKLLLLPVLLLVIILRLIVWMGVEASSIILGLGMSASLFFLVYTIVLQQWESVIIFGLVEIILVILAAGAGLIQGILQIASEDLCDLLLS